jgi:hypothetical protein
MQHPKQKTTDQARNGSVPKRHRRPVASKKITGDQHGRETGKTA